MKKIPFLLLFISVLFCSCESPKKKVYNQGIHIIPEPKQISSKEGEFLLNNHTLFYADQEDVRTICKFFMAKIAASTGWELQFSNQEPHKNAIILTLDSTLNINSEGYVLSVSKNIISVKAKTSHGLFYGLQTCMQLLPAEIESKTKQTHIRWAIPCVEIEDEPRFPYRGVMLDPCRHFLPVANIKKQLDVLSLFKINKFHWHLTDDQGWRIEIRKHPKLTELGAFRTEGDGSKYGGFYTQEEIKEVVAYAKERFITVIPEIELPGHAMAALVAYPELSCFPRTFEARNIWGVEDDVFCAGNEETFKFLEEVIEEVVQLFPGTYFHIGGDECPKQRWKKCQKCQNRIKTEKLKNENELQSYFIRRIGKVLSAHGKKMIGWDEILEGGLAPSATVMSWRGESGGIAAAKLHHDVIMTPGSAGLYLDHYQGSYSVEPVAIGGYAPLAKIYAYEPFPSSLPEANRRYIQGAQCNVWSEYLYSPELVEYRLYPRILALSELTWSPTEKRDFTDFCRRLDNAAVRLDAHNINYHIPIPEQPHGSINYIAFLEDYTLTLSSSRPMRIVYTNDGTTPTPTSNTYTEPIIVTENTIIKTACVMVSGKMSPIRTIELKKETLSPASPASPLEQGLMFKKTYDHLLQTKDIANITTWDIGTLHELKELIAPEKTASHSTLKPFVSVAEGYVDIPEDDVYFFRSDNHEVWIDEIKIIDNKNVPKKYTHSATSRALSKGLHSFRVVLLGRIEGGWPTYWNNGAVFFKPSSDSLYRPIPDSLLFHEQD